MIATSVFSRSFRSFCCFSVLADSSLRALGGVRSTAFVWVDATCAQVLVVPTVLALSISLISLMSISTLDLAWVVASTSAIAFWSFLASSFAISLARMIFSHGRCMVSLSGTSPSLVVASIIIDVNISTTVFSSGVSNHSTLSLSDSVMAKSTFLGFAGAGGHASFTGLLAVSCMLRRAWEA